MADAGRVAQLGQRAHPVEDGLPLGDPVEVGVDPRGAQPFVVGGHHGHPAADERQRHVAQPLGALGRRAAIRHAGRAVLHRRDRRAQLGVAGAARTGGQVHRGAHRDPFAIRPFGHIEDAIVVHAERRRRVGRGRAPDRVSAQLGGGVRIHRLAAEERSRPGLARQRRRRVKALGLGAAGHAGGVRAIHAVEEPAGGERGGKSKRLHRRDRCHCVSSEIHAPTVSTPVWSTTSVAREGIASRLPRWVIR